MSEYEVKSKTVRTNNVGLFGFFSGSSDQTIEIPDDAIALNTTPKGSSVIEVTYLVPV